jgi:hypothetical protein
MSEVTSCETPLGTVHVGDSVVYNFGIDDITLVVKRIEVSDINPDFFRMWGNWSDGDDTSHIRSDNEKIVAIRPGCTQQVQENVSFTVDELANACDNVGINSTTFLKLCRELKVNHGKIL